MIFAAESSLTNPAAERTSGTARMRGSNELDTGGVAADSPWKLKPADLPLTTASVFA
jgi:hypothetical protein